MADRIKDGNQGDLVVRRKGLQDKADDPKTDAKTARNARREIGNINKSLRDRTKSGKDK